MPKVKAVDRRWSLRMEVEWTGSVRSTRQPARTARVRNIGMEGLFLSVEGFSAVKGEVLQLELGIPAGAVTGDGDTKIHEIPVCMIHRWPDGLGLMFVHFDRALFEDIDRVLSALPDLSNARGLAGPDRAYLA